MFVKRLYVNEMYKRAKDKFEKSDCYVGADALKEFQSVLDGIARKRKYFDAEKILKPDLIAITKAAKKVLNEIMKNVLESKDRMSQSKKNNFDCIAPFTTTTDYLFAMTTKTLGGAHMPASFGPEIQEKIEVDANRLNDRLKEYCEISADQYYRAQRGKDADEVKASVSTLMNSIKEKKTTTSEVGELVAEYQALKKRQENHSFVWRIFHSKENNARNQLLKDMEQTVRGYVGGNVDLDRRPPTDFVKAVDHYKIEKAVEKAFDDDGMRQRLEMPKDAFGGYMNRNTQREKTEELSAALFNDLNREPKTAVKPPETEKTTSKSKQNLI